MATDGEADVELGGGDERKGEIQEEEDVHVEMCEEEEEEEEEDENFGNSDEEEDDAFLSCDE